MKCLGLLRKKYPDIPHYIFGAGRRPKEIPRHVYHRLLPVSHARDLYSRSLIWLCTSRHEGFGNPILEAMACGCAVVSTDCGGPRDIIENGTDGFLTEVGNSEQIFNYVDMLIKNEITRKKICQNAAIKVKKFTWKRSVEKLEEVLIRLFQEGKKKT